MVVALDPERIAWIIRSELVYMGDKWTNEVVPYSDMKRWKDSGRLMGMHNAMFKWGMVYAKRKDLREAAGYFFRALQIAAYAATGHYEHPTRHVRAVYEKGRLLRKNDPIAYFDKLVDMIVDE